MLFKLSLKNISKSIKDYAIYFFTLILGVAIFYVFNAIDDQSVMMKVSSTTAEIIKFMTNVLSGELYSLTAAGIEITVDHGQHADDVVSLEINCMIDHLLPTGMALAGQFLGKVTHHGADEYILNFHRGEMNIHDCQGERLYVLNKIVGTVIQD